MAKIHPTIRKNVYERDNYICQVCLKNVIQTKDIRTSEDYKLEASLDHIIPISKGGKTSEENLRTICRGCNSIKGDREDPYEIKFLSLNRGEYTRIANAIINALARTKLNSEESRILFAIISKTYGFQKSDDWVSNSQLETITEIHRAHCSRAVTRLGKRKIVTKTGNKIKLNKYFFQWKGLLPDLATVTNSGNKRLLPKQARIVTETGTEVLPKQAYTKETIQKKERKSTVARAPTPANTAKTFFKGVKDLIDKTESKERAETMAFLVTLTEKYPGADKRVIWAEIQKFYMYWTELNATGTKERWQKEKAFQVDRRLVTWFGKLNGFKEGSKQNYQNKGRGLVE